MPERVSPKRFRATVEYDGTEFAGFQVNPGKRTVQGVLEDALARLVSAYAAQGNFSACSRARDRYLASYPAGVHAAAVATRCGSR